MIEARGAIELRDDRRKRRANAPFVGAATGGGERIGPSSPPRRDEPGQWLDDEDAIAMCDALEQPRQHRLA